MPFKNAKKKNLDFKRNDVMETELKTKGLIWLIGLAEGQEGDIWLLDPY